VRKFHQTLAIAKPGGKEGLHPVRTIERGPSADKIGMPIQAMLWLAIALAGQEGQAIKPLPAIEVTAPADVTAVEGLHDAVGTLAEKVTACLTAKRPGVNCGCNYPQDLAIIRKGYETLIQQHPGWKDQLLSYRSVTKEGRPVSATLVLQNLRRQLDALKCE